MLLKRILWALAIALAVAVAAGGYFIYREFFSPNVHVPDRNKPSYLLIPTGSTFEDVVKIVSDQNLVVHLKSFEWTAKQLKYINAVKPGRYLIKPGMNNKDLITLLHSGRQTPVEVVFNNIRTKQELADRIGAQLEAKSFAILNLMNDEDYTRRIGFTPDNILSMFLPNTYEFYWNTSANTFLQKMKKEYDKYWTAEKKLKAKEDGLTQIQVSVIASIVQKETNREDEKNIVAGVYINRYKKGMKLEADPTLVYALGNFSITRVLSVYKQIDSPYNTYKYAGIPPGPICLPTQSSIDAVLNFTHHRYLYFCARDDFSGYHAFAVTYEQHQLNARRFQKALDRRGIKS